MACAAAASTIRDRPRRSRPKGHRCGAAYPTDRPESFPRRRRRSAGRRRCAGSRAHDRRSRTPTRRSRVPRTASWRRRTARRDASAAPCGHIRRWWHGLRRAGCRPAACRRRPTPRSASPPAARTHRARTHTRRDRTRGSRLRRRRRARARPVRGDDRGAAYCSRARPSPRVRAFQARRCRASESIPAPASGRRRAWCAARGRARDRRPARNCRGTRRSWRRTGSCRAPTGWRERLPGRARNQDRTRPPRCGRSARRPRRAPSRPAHPRARDKDRRLAPMRSLPLPSRATTVTLSRGSARQLSLQIDHTVDCVPRLYGDRRIDHDLFPKVDQTVENFRQSDALHVRAEIARTHEFDIGQLGVDIVGHRAFRDHGDAARTPGADPVDHTCGRARVIGLCDHIGRALGMGNDHERRVALAIAPQLLTGEALVHLAGAMPGDDLHLGLRRNILREVLVGQEDDSVGAEALDNLERIRRRAADVDLGLHFGSGVDIGDDRHARILTTQQPHVGGGDRGRERTAGLAVGDQHDLVGIEDLRSLGHEVHAALHDDVGIDLAGFARELQAVADEVGDAMIDFRCLVVVRQDDGVALALERIDRTDIGREERPFDCRHHCLDAFVEVRGLACDLRGPCQRGHGWSFLDRHGSLQLYSL